MEENIGGKNSDKENKEIIIENIILR